MIEVSISELRARLPEFLRMVGRKGPILVTSRGKEVARITAPESSRTAARKKLEALRKRAKVRDVVSPVLTSWDALE